MDYSKSIIDGADCKNTLLKAINKLSETVMATMGPNGKTVIITDFNGNPYVTKDGVSVAKSITFDDPASKAVAKLFRQVAEKTVELAGDGTTTSICLANALITLGMKYLEEKVLTTAELKYELEELERKVKILLEDSSIELKEEDIKSVATIAANNDEFIGDIIYKAYKHSSIVKVEETNKETTTLKKVDGMELDTGYFDKAFINNHSRQSIEYNDIPLIVVDGELNDLKPYASIIEENPRGIAFIADNYSAQVVSLLKQYFNRGELNVALIKSPGFATHRKDLISDIRLFTTANAFYFDKGSKVGGYVSSLKVTADKTIISVDVLNPDADRLVKELTESLDELEDTRKKLTQERIANLIGSVSIIKVGGNSEIEVKELRDRIDDAVLAVGCALEEGIVEGGGKTLQIIATMLDNKFVPCLYEPKATITSNGAKIDYTKDFFKEGIIDPVKVTRVALENAVSVAKTILTTEAIVVDPRLWN